MGTVLNPVHIDIEQFAKLCEIQATQRELALWFRCDDDTINNWCHITFGRSYLEVWKVFAVPGKISLRRAQLRNAIDKDNATMQIWLGKQYLEQAENPLDEDREETYVIPESLKL